MNTNQLTPDEDYRDATGCGCVIAIAAVLVIIAIAAARVIIAIAAGLWLFAK